MAPGTTTEPVTRPAGRPAVGPAPSAEPAHGYPPPVRPPGRAVVAYCGALMTVRGESTFTPPPDTCPKCVEVWEQQRRNGR